MFVGQRREGFVVALSEVFDLINLNPLGPTDGARNSLANKSITTFALEVPISCLTLQNQPIIGGWTTASVGTGTPGNPATRAMPNPPAGPEPCPAGTPAAPSPGAGFVPTQNCQGWVPANHPLARKPAGQNVTSFDTMAADAATDDGTRVFGNFDPCPAGQPASPSPGAGFVPTQDCGGWVPANHPLARKDTPGGGGAIRIRRRRAVHAGVAARSSARQRSGDRPQGQGQVQRERAEGRHPVPRLRDASDAARAGAGAVRRAGAGRAAQRSRRGVPDRRAGADAAAERRAVRDAAPQHQHRAGRARRSEVARRARRRQRGLPERPPSWRRRGGHRAARGGGHSARGGSGDLPGGDRRRAHQRADRLQVRWHRRPTQPLFRPTFPYLQAPLSGSPASGFYGAP